MCGCSEEASLGVGKSSQAVGGDGNRFLMGMGMLRQSFVLPQGTGAWRAEGLGLPLSFPDWFVFSLEVLEEQRCRRALPGQCSPDREGWEKQGCGAGWEMLLHQDLMRRDHLEQAAPRTKDSPTPERHCWAPQPVLQGCQHML